MKKFLRISWTIIVLAWAFLVILKTTTRFTPAQPATTLANPASVYCQQQSGTLEIVTDTSGAQSWICHLSGWVDCEERAYMRGECPSTGTIVVSTGNQWQYLLVFMQKDTENGLTIYGDVYDKDNLSNPIRSFNLPDSDTLIQNKFDNHMIGYFNSKWEYYLLTDAPGGYIQHLYKIPVSWTIEQISVTWPDSISGSEIWIGSPAFIDQENLKIAYVVDNSYTTGENDNVISQKLAIYDIPTKKATITSYDTQNIKRKVTATKQPLLYPDYDIQRFDNFKGWIVEFDVDHDGVDTQTSDYFTTCFDTNKSIELSYEACIQLFPKNRISAISNDKEIYDDTPSNILIDGKDVWVFTWIIFTDIAWDSVLWYTDSGYKFYKLDDVLNHNIK